MNSYFHARSAARRWGGVPEDYLAVEEWIDYSKTTIADARHRALRHHTLGIWEAQERFGRVLYVGERGIEVPTRLVAERHVEEDLGFIPTPQDFIKNMELHLWMSGSVRKELPLSHILGEASGKAD